MVSAGVAAVDVGGAGATAAGAGVCGCAAGFDAGGALVVSLGATALRGAGGKSMFVITTTAIMSTTANTNLTL